MKNVITISIVGLTVFSVSLFAQNKLCNTEEALSNNWNSSLPKHGSISHRPHRVSSYIAVYDSIYNWNLDASTNQWIAPGVRRIINFTYGAHENLTSETIQLWDGSAWANNYTNTFTYDANNNNTTYLYQTWSISAFVNNTIDVMTFDIHNNELSDTGKNWSGSAWVNNYLYLWDYNANNKTISETFQNWSGSAWVNSHLYLYVYNVEISQSLTPSFHKVYKANPLIYNDLIFKIDYIL